MIKRKFPPDSCNIGTIWVLVIGTKIGTVGRPATRGGPSDAPVPTTPFKSVTQVILTGNLSTGVPQVRSPRCVRCITLIYLSQRPTRRHGVVVSTLDFESRSPSSNLGGASRLLAFFVTKK